MLQFAMDGLDIEMSKYDNTNFEKHTQNDSHGSGAVECNQPSLRG